MVVFGHAGLDKLVGEPEPGKILMIVGKAGTGKTSLVLQLVKSAEHPYIVDTEGIRLKRVEQVGALHARIRRIVRFQEQFDLFEKMWLGDCDFLAVDSMVMLYRLCLAKNPDEANWMLAKQMAGLAKFAEVQKIPVAVTGHIYEWKKQQRIVSGDVAKYWAKTILLLEKGRRPGERKATLLKHPWKKEGQSTKFKICDRGVC